MKKVLIKQLYETDCGPACIASVAAYYNLKVPLTKAQEYAGTNKKGTSLMGLIECAQKFGFKAKGIRAKLSDLFEIPLPSIAHMKFEGHRKHYVVIYDIDKNYLKIMDPSTGRINKRLYKGFAKEWTGILLILLPKKSIKIGNENT